MLRLGVVHLIVIIEHAPSKAACHLIVSVKIIQRLRKRIDELDGSGILGPGIPISPPVIGMFCDHIGDMGWILRITVIDSQEVIYDHIIVRRVAVRCSRHTKLPAHAMSIPCGIQLLGDSFTFSVKVEIPFGRRFIRPCAPTDNRRVVPVSQDHLLQIVLKFCLPLIVTDMLPSWGFLKHQKPNLIATV